MTGRTLDTMVGRRVRGGVVHFPTREPRCYQLVFGDSALQEWGWLDPTELAARTVRWLAPRADARVTAVVERLIDRGEAVKIDVMARPDGPALPPVVSPMEVVDATVRLDAATDVLRVEAHNPPTPEVGYPGLWCALAVAGAAAEATGGVWFDAVALRVRRDAAPPSFGPVRIGEHLLLAQTGHGPDGPTLATRGLGAFGLPELAVTGVAGALAPAAGLVMQGVAQRLVEGLVDDLRDGSAGEVPHELVLTGGHVARAAAGARPRDGAAVRVRLEHRPAVDDESDDHLLVEPAAADVGRSRAEWVRLVVADLVAT